MKDLNEEELYKALYSESRNYDITTTEMLAPNYDVWGRARSWLINHAVFLVAGIVPCEHWNFPHLVECNFEKMYETPFAKLEREHQKRLKQVYMEFITIFSLEGKKYLTLPFSEPRKIIGACKNNPEIAGLIPQHLAQVVETLGPHPSLNLPPDFINLEIGILKRHYLHLKHNLEKQYGPVEPRQNIIKPDKSTPELFRNRPEQLVKDIVQRAAILIWKKSREKQLHHVLQDNYFRSAAKAAALLANKKDGYEDETLANWIRDLSPNYKPKPRKKK